MRVRVTIRPPSLVCFAQLLQESMTGHALTAIFVCLSQAPDNCAQSKYALDFGEVFSHLAVRPRRTLRSSAFPTCAALFTSRGGNSARLATFSSFRPLTP